MEEDIKILEGLLGFISVLNKEQRQAIENLLTRYKELENEIKFQEKYIFNLHSKYECINQ